MSTANLTVVAIAVTLATVVAAAAHQRRVGTRPSRRTSVLTPVVRRQSQRGVRAYARAIRQQPALGLKAASALGFFASYCLSQTLVDGLLLIGVAAAVGFPLGFMIWSLRR